MDWNEQTLHLRAGTAAEDGDSVAVAPQNVGLKYTGLRVVDLLAGAKRAISTGFDEAALLPLSGSCTVTIDSEPLQLRGRSSVFEAVSDFAYLPLGCDAVVTSERGGQFALLTARATRRLRPQYVPAEAVGVEVRGAGAATRQINNFLSPQAPVEADKLIGVEVLTPAGNFSSYPPHKHDVADSETGEAEVEEIYYFRFQPVSGYALYRQYTADGEFDVCTVVRDGDVFLVPRGFHGPSVPVPGHHMYFLNVLAGPSEERTMQFSDDPEQHWIRETWLEDSPDPRVPMTSADRGNPDED